MKEQTTGAKRRNYDAAFKQEVLQMAQNGRPVKDVSQSLGAAIYRWRSPAKNRVLLRQNPVWQIRKPS